MRTKWAIHRSTLNRARLAYRLIILLLAVSVLTLTWFGATLFSPPIRPERYLSPGVGSAPTVLLKFYQIPQIGGLYPVDAKVEPEDITFPSSMSEAEWRADPCISGLYYAFDWTPGGPDPYYFGWDFSDLCERYFPGQIAGTASLTRAVQNDNGPVEHLIGIGLSSSDTPPNQRDLARDAPVDTVNDPFYFPWDQLEISIPLVLVDNRMANGLRTSNLVVPSLSVAVDSPDWDSHLAFSDVQVNLDSAEEPARLVQITLRRPLSNQILTAAIFAILALCILMLPFVRDDGSALQVTAAVLFSLWALRGNLVPTYLPRFNLLDSFILFGYLLLAFAVFFRFVARPALRHLKAQYEHPSASTDSTNVTQSGTSIYREQVVKKPASSSSWNFTMILAASLALIAWLQLTKRK